MPGTALGSKEHKASSSSENKVISDRDRMVKQSQLGNGMWRDLGGGRIFGKVLLRYLSRELNARKDLSTG